MVLCDALLLLGFRVPTHVFLDDAYLSGGKKHELLKKIAFFCRVGGRRADAV